MQIVWVILSDDYRCFQCRRHEHSPNHTTFVNVLHSIFWRTVQHLSHSIIHSVQEWPWFLRSIVQVCSLTMEYRVFQHVPSTNISEQFGSILVTILPRISFLFWNDGHQCMELILCRVVESSCSPTHNIVPHISWHDLPCHRTMKKYEDFEGMEVSLFPLLKFAIRTWFCNCPQYLCLFGIVVECSPSFHDPGKMLVLPNRLLCWVLSTSDQDFVSFQPIWCHPHTQIRPILFHDVQRDIPNLEFSPSHVSIGFSQIAFPIIDLPKDDRTNSFQEERLGLSMLNYDLGQLCRGGRIQMSGHSDFGIFINVGASLHSWLECIGR